MGAKITGGIVVGGVLAGGAPTPARDALSSQYTTGQPDFDRDAFTAALQSKGYDVVWEQAAFCPNRGRAGIGNKDHPIACTFCDGSGWVFHNPKRTRMLITGVSLQQNFYAQGGWSSGRVNVTAQPEYRFHEWDRITLCTGVGRFPEILRRQPGTDLDKPKYTPLCVAYLSWIDRSKTLRVFTQEEDFVLTDEGYIQWPDPRKRPDDGSYYSISYEYHPRYVIQELSHQHRMSTVKDVHYEFPVAGTARLDFLIRDESKDDPQTEYENPFEHP